MGNCVKTQIKKAVTVSEAQKKIPLKQINDQKSELVSVSVSEIISDSMPKSVSESEIRPESVSEITPESVSEITPESESEIISEIRPESVSEIISEITPESVKEQVSVLDSAHVYEVNFSEITYISLKKLAKKFGNNDKFTTKEHLIKWLKNNITILHINVFFEHM